MGYKYKQRFHEVRKSPEYELTTVEMADHVSDRIKVVENLIKRKFPEQFGDLAIDPIMYAQDIGEFRDGCLTFPIILPAECAKSAASIKMDNIPPQFFNTDSSVVVDLVDDLENILRVFAYTEDEIDFLVATPKKTRNGTMKKVRTISTSGESMLRQYKKPRFREMRNGEKVIVMMLDMTKIIHDMVSSDNERGNYWIDIFRLKKHRSGEYKVTCKKVYDNGNNTNKSKRGQSAKDMVRDMETMFNNARHR